MNTRAILSTASAAALTAGLLFSCSSAPEQKPQDEYFAPVDQVVLPAGDSSGSQRVLRRDRRAAPPQEGITPAVYESLREQNKRIDELERRVAAVTNAGSASSSNQDGSGENLPQDRTGSTKLVLDLIRDQNRRLGDVTERLRAFADAETERQKIAVIPSAAAASPAALRDTAAAARRRVPTMTYAKAVALYESGKYEKAVRAFQSLLVRGKNIARADYCRFWAGVCYFQLNKIPKALEEFRTVVQTAGSPKRESAFFMTAQCYERTGETAQAKLVFQRLVQEYPSGSLKPFAEKKIALLE